jgi:hypothetical protein
MPAFGPSSSTDLVDPGVCQGRLTLTSGTPVDTADVASSSNIYWTPYNGNNISLYDGSSAWTTLTFAEQTIALASLTAGKLYDIFAYNNSGAIAFDAPLAWTSDTARATALTLQNGIYVKNGATTRRYLGTFRSISTTQTCDTSVGDVVNTNSVTGRLLYNHYNRVRKRSTTFYGDLTTSSTSLAVLSTTGINIVQGVAENAVFMLWNADCSNSTLNDGWTMQFYDRGGTIGNLHTGVCGVEPTTDVSSISVTMPYASIGYRYLQVAGNAVTGGTAKWAASELRVDMLL